MWNRKNLTNINESSSSKEKIDKWQKVLLLLVICFKTKSISPAFVPDFGEFSVALAWITLQIYYGSSRSCRSPMDKLAIWNDHYLDVINWLNIIAKLMTLVRILWWSPMDMYQMTSNHETHYSALIDRHDLNRNEAAAFSN